MAFPVRLIDAGRSMNWFRIPHKWPINLRATISTRAPQYRRQFYSTTNSFEDPDRSGLFYHLVPPPTPSSSEHPSYAVSFLSHPPKGGNSSTIIGWLPAIGTGQTEGAGLNDFKENYRFREILHQAIRRGLEEGVDDIQINGATQLRQGWMHINDERNVPALGRIGDPDDIVASVLVEDGKIQAGSYQPMPSYRFCTVDGLIHLTPGLAKKLQSVLEDKAREE